MAYDMAYTNDKLGDPTTPSGLRKGLVRRLGGMRANRSGWDAYWLELARFNSPRISRYLTAFGVNATGQGNWSQNVTIKQDMTNNKLLDGRAVWASDVLANGMHSGLTHPSRPWFKIGVTDPDLQQYQPVREWCDTVTGRLFDFFASTNFYTSAKGGYRELGIFGIEAAFFERHWNYGGVVHPLTVGEYWIGLDDGLVADSLYRLVNMTVLQHYEKFLKGKNPNAVLPQKVTEAYDRGNYDQLFPVYHAVEPNDLRDPRRLDARGKKFRSAYWSGICGDNEAASDDKALLAVEGYNSKPFWAPRWDVNGSDTYGSNSPGMNAYSDVRQLQLQILRKQQAIDFTVKPALAGPATLNNVHAALQPGRITAMAGVDKDSFRPIWEIRPEAIGHILKDTEETRQAVDRSYYVDLFNAITNMQGIQPRNVEEIASRNEEKLTQLGPAVERVNQEKLSVAIDRAYDILESSGALPPPPPELHGKRLTIKFISVLAQAQRLIGLGSIERLAGYITSIVQVFPDAADKFDAQESVDEYADIVGVSPKMIRSDDAVKALGQARQDAQQQAQSAQVAAPAAAASKDGALAAQLLFKPGESGDPSLAHRLLGTPN